MITAVWHFSSRDATLLLPQTFSNSWQSCTLLSSLLRNSLKSLALCVAGQGTSHPSHVWFSLVLWLNQHGRSLSKIWSSSWPPFGPGSEGRCHQMLGASWLGYETAHFHLGWKMCPWGRVPLLLYQSTHNASCLPCLFWKKKPSSVPRQWGTGERQYRMSSPWFAANKLIVCFMLLLISRI